MISVPNHKFKVCFNCSLFWFLHSTIHVNWITFVWIIMACGVWVGVWLLSILWNDVLEIFHIQLVAIATKGSEIYALHYCNIAIAVGKERVEYLLINAFCSTTIDFSYRWICHWLLEGLSHSQPFINVTGLLSTTPISPCSCKRPLNYILI